MKHGVTDSDTPATIDIYYALNKAIAVICFSLPNIAGGCKMIRINSYESQNEMEYASYLILVENWNWKYIYNNT